MLSQQEAPSHLFAAQENPFGEAFATSADSAAIGFAPWSESLTPFAATLDDAASESGTERLVAEVYAELRDEAFDEALAFLAEETEQALSERFVGETPASAPERERYAEAQLAPVRFEAQQYLQALETGVAGLDVESLSEQQLDEVLDRFDPQAGELTPAGEEFIGKLIKKAKGVVKTVAKAAKSVGKVAGALLGPVLKKLRALINPLLRRVLSFAIGRLPAPLQPHARKLAARFTSEAEESNLDEAAVSPANLTDVEALAESFDAAVAEALAGNPADDLEAEAFAGMDQSEIETRELEMLAEARGVLIERLRDADENEDLAPAVEQFVPALLGALRLGINLVGRPKVVGFLAKYLGQLIGKWVGPELKTPLSNAIVDTGLRLISLEAETGTQLELGDEVAPVALASVIEETVRQLAENEDYVFEDEELTQLATSEAFSKAVATHFPPRFVRPSLQQAPSLGGTFVSRRPRSIRTYRKYSRTPEIQVTSQIADVLPTFGGSTVGAAMRAAGAQFPVRARMHIYQSAPGTTLPRMVRMDRPTAGQGRGYINAGNVHPLTPAAAGVLLREPKLGVQVPAAYLRSRQRIAAGQRFYILEPLGAGAPPALPGGAAGQAAAARLTASRAWTTVNLRQARISVGIYLSEAEAQAIAEAIRKGRGSLPLLQALIQTYREMEQLSAGGQAPVRIVREDSEDGEAFEEFAARAGRLLSPGFTAQLRRRLRAWVMPALTNWARANAEAFVRAAAHPDPGVTLRIRLTAVPGLDLMARAGAAVPSANSMRGNPSIAISVTPGKRRK
jgi:hypothetical protein